MFEEKRTRHIEPDDIGVRYGRIVQTRDDTDEDEGVLAVVIHCGFVQRSAIRELDDTFKDIVEVFSMRAERYGATSPLATGLAGLEQSHTGRRHQVGPHPGRGRRDRWIS